MEHEAIVDGAATRPKSATRSPTSRPRCSTSRRQFEDAATSPTLPPTRSSSKRRSPSRAWPRSTRSPGSRPEAEAAPEVRHDDEDESEDEDDDFFDEQRLSDELDQALEAPLAG